MSRFSGMQKYKPYYEKIGVACPKCGKDIVLKKTKKGRKYYGCIDNPECDFMSWQKPSKVRCKECGGLMVEKGKKAGMHESGMRLCGRTMKNRKKHKKNDGR